MYFRLVLRVYTHLAISFFLRFSFCLLFLSRQLAVIQPKNIKTNHRCETPLCVLSTTTVSIHISWIDVHTSLLPMLLCAFLLCFCVFPGG